MIEKLKFLFQKYRNFILYCCIGCINTGVDFGVFALLDYAGLYYIIAHVISYHCGIFCSFFLNRYYNFKVKDKAVQRFISFYASSLIAMVLSAGILYALVSLLGLPHLLGKLIATAIIVIAQFLFVKNFTFKK